MSGKAKKSPEPEGPFGKELERSGAALNSKYHDNEQDVVGVPVTELRDASSSANEEMLQFTAGTFFASGAFWLGFERAITVGREDPLLWVCGLSVVFGAILAGVGYRQTARRVKRLMRYCPPDESA